MAGERDAPSSVISLTEIASETGDIERGRIRMPGRSRQVARAAVASQRLRRVVPGDPSRRRQRTLSRLSSHGRGPFPSRLGFREEPDGPGHLRDHAFLLEATEFLEPRPGLRRWIARRAVHGGFNRWPGTRAIIHHNGSVALTAAIGGAKNSRAQLGGDHIFAAVIESAVADFMALIRAANLKLGTSEYDVQVGIEYVSSTTQNLPSRNRPDFRHRCCSRHLTDR